MNAPKTTQLSPEEWKGLCVLNAVQFHAFLQSIPGQNDDGSVGLTDRHLELAVQHMDRWRSFLQAWARSAPIVHVQPPAHVELTKDEVAAAPRFGRRGRPKKTAQVSAQ